MKESSNQKMQENKPVLELKNTEKKVRQNMCIKCFWFYSPCHCALPHRAQPFMHVHGVHKMCIKMQLSTWHLGYTWRFDLIKFHVPFWNLHFYIQQWDLNWKVFADLSFGDREVQLFPINLDSRVFTKRASDRANLDISRTISYRFCIPH